MGGRGRGRHHCCLVQHRARIRPNRLAGTPGGRHGGLTARHAADMEWERNVLGSTVTRLRTDGAMLTIVHGRQATSCRPTATARDR
jgi:hypothetical protein